MPAMHLGTFAIIRTLATTTVTILLLAGNCCNAEAYLALPGAAAAAGSSTQTLSAKHYIFGGDGKGTNTGEKTHTKHMTELMTGTYSDRMNGVATAYSNDAAKNFAFLPPPSSQKKLLNDRKEFLHTFNSKANAYGHKLGSLPEEHDYADTVYSELEAENKHDMLSKLEKDLSAEQEIITKSKLLVKMLEDPNLQTLPIIYIEDEQEEYSDENADGNSLNDLIYGFGGIGGARPGNGVLKRSRYYRRFPWKRHNKNRSQYEPELRYACTPSKEDVLKLLKILHENQKGNHNKTLNFCNRKRPANVIFTNIRFLG